MLIFYAALFVVISSILPAVLLNYTIINWLLLFFADVVIVTAFAVLRKDFLVKNFFSPIAIFAALTIIHFGIPSVYLSYDNSIFANNANYAYINSAILLILFSIPFYYIGYKLVYFSTMNKRLADKSVEFNENRIKQVITIFIVLGYIVRLYIIASGGYFQIARATQAEELKGAFYTFFYTIEVFPLYALCLASIALWAKQEELIKGKWKLIVISLIISEFLYWFISGRKEQTLMSLLYPVIVYNIMTLKLPSKKVIITFLLFLIVYFPLNFYYRLLLETGQYRDINPLEVLTNPVFLQGFSEFGQENTSSEGTLFSRLNLMESVSGCIRIKEEDKWTDFPGENYFAIVSSIVPRFLWKNKPNYHYGDVFGYLAGITYPNDFETSISVTFIGESYLNFKFLGVIIIGFFGSFFAFFYKRVFSSNHYLPWLLVYITALLPVLIYIGGTFTLYFAGLIKLIPFSYLIGLYIIKK